MSNESVNVSFVFFGSSIISIIVLEELEKSKQLPSLIVTTPDKPKGRGLEITPSPVKVWASKRGIPVITPGNLNDPVVIKKLKDQKAIIFVLVSYGKILPKEIIDIPPKGILNLHPSLLPFLRGPSPIETSILNNTHDMLGVSIMLIDEKMDHGPILKQKRVNLPHWPVGKKYLESIFGNEGGKLLAETLPEWVSGNIREIAQDDSKATYCKLIKKEDGLLDLTADDYANYLKYLAFEEWPQTYFFLNNGIKDIRVKITKATYIDSKFVIQKVIPQDKKEVAYDIFLKSLKF